MKNLQVGDVVFCSRGDIPRADNREGFSPRVITLYQGWDQGDVEVVLPPGCYLELVAAGGARHCSKAVVRYRPLNRRKIRRRIEDRLRKTASLDELIRVAEILGVMIN